MNFGFKAVTSAVKGAVARRRKQTESEGLINDPAYRLFCVLVEPEQLIIDAGCEKGDFLLLCHDMNHKSILGFEPSWNDYQTCTTLFPKFNIQRTVIGQADGDSIIKRAAKGGDNTLENVAMTCLDKIADQGCAMDWIHVGSTTDFNQLVNGGMSALKANLPGIVLANGSRIYPGTVELLTELGYRSNHVEAGQLVPIVLRGGLHVWSTQTVILLHPDSVHA